MTLVDALQPSMLRVARMYVSTQAVAEEVVQDAWLGVLKGIDRFEGRSSLTHLDLPHPHQHRQDARATRRAQRSLRGAGGGRPRRAHLGSSSFLGPEEAWAGHWSSLPNDWRGSPQDRLDAAETRAVAARAIAELPPMQAEVIRLRDVAGWTSEEVRNALDLTETNQRVLLHRARGRVRRALDDYLEADA